MRYLGKHELKRCLNPDEIEPGKRPTIAREVEQKLTLSHRLVPAKPAKIRIKTPRSEVIRKLKPQKTRETKRPGSKESSIGISKLTPRMPNSAVLETKKNYRHHKIRNRSKNVRRLCKNGRKTEPFNYRICRHRSRRGT